MWVNNLEEGAAFVFVDSAGRVGQIFVPADKSSAARDSLKLSFDQMCVDTPVVKSIQIREPNNVIFSGLHNNPLQSTRNLWEVRALNTNTGLRESLLVPCADVSLLTPGTDSVDLGVEPWLTFVDRLRQYWHTPSVDTYGPMQINAIEYVTK